MVAGPYRRWAELMKRHVPNQRGPSTTPPASSSNAELRGCLKRHALVLECHDIGRLLRHLREPLEPPQRSPARDPPYFESQVLRRKAGPLNRPLAQAAFDPRTFAHWVRRRFILLGKFEATLPPSTCFRQAYVAPNSHREWRRSMDRLGRLPLRAEGAPLFRATEIAHSPHLVPSRSRLERIPRAKGMPRRPGEPLGTLLCDRRCSC